MNGYPDAEPLGQKDVFKTDAEILIPAALEKQITADNVNDIKARLIVEGANGPTTPEAHKVLHERGVFVVPDILANAGGVTVSYFEWVQDRHGYFWTEKEVNERLEAKMCQAFEVVLDTAQKYKVDMRVAAYIVAINRVATVTKLRGMYAVRAEVVRSESASDVSLPLLTSDSEGHKLGHWLLAFGVSR